MQSLFIIDNEVSRRAITPVLDIFIKNGSDCRILANSFCTGIMKDYAARFIDPRDSVKVTWQFVISANPVKRHRLKGRLVSIAHGSMFGNSAWSLNRAFHADIYFGLSPHELPYIKRHLGDRFDENKFIATGSPANDKLIDFLNPDQNSKVKIKQTLGLTDRKTILLSSHWTSLGLLRRFGTGLLDAIAWNFPDHQIICTCHPGLLASPKSEFHINKIIKTPYFDARWLINSLKSKQSRQVKMILNEATPAELLHVSDIFVGDNSSFLAEASLFEIPLLACSAGSYFDKTISEIISSDTHQFKNIEELVGNLKAVGNSDQENIKTGDRIKELFMYNIGFSAEAIVENLDAMG